MIIWKSITQHLRSEWHNFKFDKFVVVVVEFSHMAEVKGVLKMGSVDLPIYHQDGGVCVLNVEDGNADAWPVLVPAKDGKSVEMQFGDGGEKTIRVTLPVGSHIEAPTSIPHTKYIIDIV